MMLRVRFLGAALVAAGLAACSGGSGSLTPPPTTLQAPQVPNDVTRVQPATSSQMAAPPGAMASTATPSAQTAQAIAQGRVQSFSRTRDHDDGITVVPTASAVGV
ncbi:MAG: hypothetical protein M3R44_01925 [Candidatus Eremiobacteraeota bacterium]|nr:hypothetical protein [Candidatus Eremiobacteraeota bacterium]